MRSKIVVIMLLAMICGTQSHAQSFLKNLGQSIKKEIKKEVKNAVEKGVSDAKNKVKDKVSEQAQEHNSPEANIVESIAPSTAVSADSGENVERQSGLDYIDEYGVNHGGGILIGDILWAPVNSGYHPTDYPYGKLYQWGRKHGQGYGPPYLICPGSQCFKLQIQMQ